VQVGSVLGTTAFLLAGLMPDDTFLAWGWRIPFLASFVLIGVALWVRLRVEESPVFKQLKQGQKVVKLPIREAVTRYPRSFLVGIGAHICDTAIYYVYATFTLNYLTETLGVARPIALTGVVLYGLVLIITQPLYGALSDRIGRRPINLFSVVFTAAFAIPYFALLNTEVPALI
jgi:MFS family permease